MIVTDMDPGESIASFSLPIPLNDNLYCDLEASSDQVAASIVNKYVADSDISSCDSSSKSYKCFPGTDIFKEIDISELKFIKAIGKGSFGAVYKALWNGKHVAVKMVETDTEVMAFDNEIKHLSRVKHENIIQMYGTGTSLRAKCIIMEFAMDGSLYQFLHCPPYSKYSLSHALSWLLQCAKAIAYLHSIKPKPLIHRDLKPLNMLLTNEKKVLKICDFGTACDLRSVMTDNRGSTAWMAPEVIKGSNYNEKCDVYSWGMILWEILTRRIPFEDLGQTYRILWQVVHKVRPPLIQGCPKPIEWLMKRCWLDEQNDRPNMNEVLDVICPLHRIMSDGVELISFCSSSAESFTGSYMSQINEESGGDHTSQDAAEFPSSAAQSDSNGQKGQCQFNSSPYQSHRHQDGYGDDTLIDKVVPNGEGIAKTSVLNRYPDPFESPVRHQRPLADASNRPEMFVPLSIAIPQEASPKPHPFMPEPQLQICDISPGAKPHFMPPIQYRVSPHYAGGFDTSLQGIGAQAPGPPHHSSVSPHSYNQSPTSPSNFLLNNASLTSRKMSADSLTGIDASNPGSRRASSCEPYGNLIGFEPLTNELIAQAGNLNLGSTQTSSMDHSCTWCQSSTLDKNEIDGTQRTFRSELRNVPVVQCPSSSNYPNINSDPPRKLNPHFECSANSPPDLTRSFPPSSAFSNKDHLYSRGHKAQPQHSMSSEELDSLWELLDDDLKPMMPLPSCPYSQQIFEEHKKLAHQLLFVQEELFLLKQQKRRLVKKLEEQDVEESACSHRYSDKITQLKDRNEILRHNHMCLSQQLDGIRKRRQEQTTDRNAVGGRSNQSVVTGTPVYVSHLSYDLSPQQSRDCLAQSTTRVLPGNSDAGGHPPSEQSMYQHKLSPQESFPRDIYRCPQVVAAQGSTQIIQPPLQSAGSGTQLFCEHSQPPLIGFTHSTQQQQQQQTHEHTPSNLSQPQGLGHTQCVQQPSGACPQPRIPLGFDQQNDQSYQSNLQSCLQPSFSDK